MVRLELDSRRVEAKHSSNDLGRHTGTNSCAQGGPKTSLGCFQGGCGASECLREHLQLLRCKN